MSDKVDKQIAEILKRLKRLESAVFPAKGQSKTKTQQSNFTGAKGGVLLLISKNYFTKRRSADEVMKALEENGYHYRREVIQTALNRLSAKKGQLTKLMEKGRKVYVKRK